MKGIITLFKNTYTDWSEAKASRLAAALAYYTVFSLAPLLILAIGLAGLILGPAAAQGQIVGQIQSVVGPATAQTIQSMIANTSQQRLGGTATVVGAVTLLIGAMGVLIQLQSSLDTIWGVQLKPGRSFLKKVWHQLYSYGLLLLTGLLLFVSLLVGIALSGIVRYFHSFLPNAGSLWTAVQLVVSFIIFTLLFATLFKVLPNAEVRWKNVWIGAAFTALLFDAGKYLISLYLAHSSVASSFGASGSLVLLLLWIYYSAQIFLFGAAFTEVYSRRNGEPIQPKPDAVALTSRDRAQQGIPRQSSLEKAAATGQSTEQAGAKQPPKSRPGQGRAPGRR